MGRPNKPAEIKKLTGTYNVTDGRRSGEVDMTEADYSDLTMPPEHLSDRGKELWIRIIAYHARWKLNLPNQYEYIESYCRAYEIREEAWRDMQENGMYVEEQVGRRLSQSYKVYNEQVDKMMALGQKLFLTAVDKSKVNASAIDEGANRKDKNSIKTISVTG